PRSVPGLLMPEQAAERRLLVSTCLSWRCLSCHEAVPKEAAAATLVLAEFEPLARITPQQSQAALARHQQVRRLIDVDEQPGQVLLVQEWQGYLDHACQQLHRRAEPARFRQRVAALGADLQLDGKQVVVCADPREAFLHRQAITAQYVAA